MRKKNNYKKYYSKYNRDWKGSKTSNLLNYHYPSQRRVPRFTYAEDRSRY